MRQPGPTDREFEEFLTSRTDEWRDVATFLESARTHYQQEVSEELRARHVRAVLAEAGTLPAPVQIASRRRRIARVAAVAAAASLSFSLLATGLAYAGVITLPEPARAALERIGITVPVEQQPPASEVGPAVLQRPTRESAEAPPSPHPTTSRSRGPGDNANERARARGDNANERAEQRGDNADDPGHQRENRGDNADQRSKGDNADERAGDSPASEGDSAGDPAQ